MFKSVTNEDAGCAVWYCGPGDTPKAQWEPVYEGVQAASEWGAKHNVRLAVMHVIDPAFPVPNADQRSRLRAGVHVPTFDPYIAFVHDNPLLRGFLTTLDWARPHRLSETAFFKNIRDAQAWLEERRGRTFPMFADMCTEAGVHERFK